MQAKIRNTMYCFWECNHMHVLKPDEGFLRDKWSCFDLNELQITELLWSVVLIETIMFIISFKNIDVINIWWIWSGYIKKSIIIYKTLFNQWQVQHMLSLIWTRFNQIIFDLRIFRFSITWRRKYKLPPESKKHITNNIIMQRKHQI